MLRLMLLRHAKSSWGDPAIDDCDRKLSSRGKAAAQAMGRALGDRNLVPGLVLCSPARRAHDTWKIMAEELNAAPKLTLVEDIYDFGNGGRLVDVIRRHGGDVESLLLVGHNPSLERLAARLTGDGDRRLRERLQKKFPTGALAVFEADLSSWTGFSEEAFAMTHFIRPKDVMTDND